MKRTLQRSLPAFLMMIVLVLTMAVQPVIAATQVKYGKPYHIQNQESDDQSYQNYLNADGSPGLQCSGTTKHSVFNDSVLDLAEKTGIWKIISASGAEDGTPVSIGDLVYLQNQGPDDESYLNACDLVDFSSIDQVYIYTNDKSDWAGQETGTWKIISASGAEDGTPVSIDDLVYLQNQWSFYIQPGNFKMSALNFLKTCSPGSCDLQLKYGNSIIAGKDATWKWKFIPQNMVPVVNKPIPDQVTTVGQNYIYTIPTGTFTDADGDKLTLSATLEDGSELPAWLTFNPSTNTFSGTPAAGDVGTVTIKVSANDGIHITSTTFTLTVNDICRISAGVSTVDCVVTLPEDGTPVTVPIKIQTPADPYTLPLDLMLLQDLSGSFKDDLNILDGLIPDLVRELQTLQPDTYFGLSAFVDKPIGDLGRSGDYVYQTLLKLTADSDAFQNAVNNLIIKGGGDLPESSLEALLQVAVRASELSVRQGARSAVIVSTDDTYHKAGDGAKAGIYTPNNGDAILDGNGLGEDYPSVAQVKAAINKANLLPIFLAAQNPKSSNNTEAAFQDLVNHLGVGAVVKLASDSSNLIEALKDALEIVNQQLTIVVNGDDCDYVINVEPEYFTDIKPGEEVTTNVTFSYPGDCIDDSVTIRAIGLGDLDIKVVINLTDID